MHPTTEYDDPLKSVAWACWWGGYKQGYHVEEYDTLDYKTAKLRFEQYWETNT